jgi:hypothetical protein
MGQRIPPTERHLHHSSDTPTMSAIRSWIISSFLLLGAVTGAQAQDFQVTLFGVGDQQITVYPGDGQWVNHTDNSSGDVTEDGSNFLLWDGVTLLMILNDAKDAELEETGAVTDGLEPPSSIGAWECVEF